MKKKGQDIFNKKKKQGDKQFWIQYGKKNLKLIVFYGQDVLDLTKFSSIHPGSKQALKNYSNMDVKDIIFKVYPHSYHTLQVIQKYKIGTLTLCAQRRKFSVSLTKSKKLMTDSKLSEQKDIRKSSQKNYKRKVTFSNEAKRNKRANKEKKHKSQITTQPSDQDLSLQFEEQKPNFSIPIFLSKSKSFSSN